MSETVTITIPMVPDRCLLPNARIKTHYLRQHQHMVALRTAAKYAALGSASIIGPVSIHYMVHWPTGRRRPDCDAIPTSCKPALDGLVDAGIITGDGPDTVVSVTAQQCRTTDDGRIEIDVRSVA